MRELLEPVLSARGFELFEVEHKPGRSGVLLRLTIDRIVEGPVYDEGAAAPEGEPQRSEAWISADDCASVDRLVTPILEVEDVISGPYRLEVSSPGIERPLRGPRDYRRFEGKRARLQVERSREGEQASGPPVVDVLSGLITAPDDDGFMLVPDKGAPVRVDFARVRKANLEFRFEDHRAG